LKYSQKSEAKVKENREMIIKKTYLYILYYIAYYFLFSSRHGLYANFLLILSFVAERAIKICIASAF